MRNGTIMNGRSGIDSPFKFVLFVTDCRHGGFCSNYKRFFGAFLNNSFGWYFKIRKDILIFVLLIMNVI